MRGVIDKRKIVLLKESLVQEENQVYRRVYSKYTEFNKYWSCITSTQIWEKLFENFENIKICVGTINKIFKDNDFL